MEVSKEKRSIILKPDKQVTKISAQEVPADKPIGTVKHSI